MARTVLKFGGTSVGDLDRIANVAEIVKARAEKGEHLAVVVSAMSGETNKLVALAEGAAGNNLPRELFDDEYDVVVASGEQVTAGLLALALRKRGLKARSWLGWQLKLKTNKSHGKARIMGFDDSRLPDSIDAGEIAVIAASRRDRGRARGNARPGRLRHQRRGRGRRAERQGLRHLHRCRRRLHDRPAHRAEGAADRKNLVRGMLEMASLGAKVLQTRSVEMAMNHNVPVRVLSSFLKPGEPNPGTLVCAEEEIVEKQVVSGVAYSRDEAKVTLYGMPDKPGVSAKLFAVLAQAGINVDMIVQANARGPDRANMVFTCTDRDSPFAKETLEKMKDEIGFESMEVTRDVSKVSIIGVGMKSHTGVAETMFRALSEKNINIDVIATSEIKISVLIAAPYTELAVRALHTAFGLDAE